jgi:hypothetical protein
MKEQNNRTRIIGVRLKLSEYERIEGLFRRTTCKKISDYVRQVLLNKPTVVTYRNTSMDDFMAEAVLLRKELNALGNNFNQVVRKLNTLSASENISTLLKEYEMQRQLLALRMDAIDLMVEKAALLW